jgi:DNA-binding NarL/FixJ family response regulator
MVNKTRALIVEAEPAFRAELRTALGAHVEVVGEVSHAADGVPFVAAEAVDLIVMSLHGAEGCESAQALLQRDPGLVLVLLNRRDADDPAAPAARGSSELGGLVKVLLGLGSPARRCERYRPAAAFG